MNTKINIMGLEISVIEYEYLKKLLNEYLADDYMNTIFMISTKMLQQANEDPEYKEMLGKVDVLLPGEDTLLSMHHVDLLEMVGMVVDYTSFAQLLKEMQDHTKTIYFLGRNEEEIAMITSFCNNNFPVLKILGSSCRDLEADSDSIINSINGVAPDILLSTIDSLTQGKWIVSNYMKLNAKLCISFGDIIDNVIRDYKGTPNVINRLHLHFLYNLLMKNGKTKNLFKTRIFRKKFAQYKNKKGDIGHGDSR